MHIGSIEHYEAARRIASDPVILSVIRRHLLTPIPFRPLQAVVCTAYASVMILIALPASFDRLAIRAQES